MVESYFFFIHKLENNYIGSFFRTEGFQSCCDVTHCRLNVITSLFTVKLVPGPTSRNYFTELKTIYVNFGKTNLSSTISLESK